jgi:hypothetical protein
LKTSLENIAKSFSLEILTMEQMREWIRTWTDLIELSPWIFILNEESIWISWEIITEQLLEI